MLVWLDQGLILMRKSYISAAIAALFAVVAVAPAVADETGMAGIHSWRKVGKKTCLVEHTHSGTGSGPSLKAAEASTVNSWASFTAFEYGSNWGDYRFAHDKRMRCGRGNSGGFSCDLEATPCRPY
jgi:hypothetical protein